ncbi:MAG: hypothetical protein KDC10_00240 [Calditrichaeota bacterium]|nr:hypothetical protein [Candidatus Cloacimonadota bacterium]MCB1045599.1 hypothetical protein [Calditrichota bacterium]
MKKKDRIQGKKALFVLGLGLGYQVDALRQRKDGKAKIYAIERYEDVFERAVSTQSWDASIDQDVEFWIGKDLGSVLEHLDEVTKDMAEEDWDIITNQPSIRLDPRYYKTLLRAHRKQRAAKVQADE